MNERWFGPVLGVVALALAGGTLAFIASGMGGMSEDLVYYWSPTELVQAGAKAQDATVRLGGVVEAGSMSWDPDASFLAFRLSDGGKSVPVECSGAPPQMFREGIGVVVEGEMHADGVFRTDRVMIKHSNEYRAPHDGEMPSEMFKTLVTEDGAS